MIITGGMTFSGGFNLTGQAVYLYQPETFSSSTVLLVQADKTFYYDDTSVFNTIITAPGLTSATSFIPSSFTSISPSDGSGSFPGTGTQYLSLSAANDAFNFGTGPFTLECWIYPTAYGFNGVTASETIDFWINPGGSYLTGQYQIQLNTNGTIAFYLASGVNTYVTVLTTTAAPLNAWSHIAVVRVGTTLNIYLNGVNSATTTGITQAIGVTGAGSIGRQTATNNYHFNGYISNVRIIHGRALYTSNFTTATQALTTTPAPLDAGNYSFDLAASSYVSTPSDATLAYGTADFTIECWFRLTNATSSYRNIWGQNSGSILRFGNTGFGDKLQFAVDQSSVANVWSCAVTASSVLNTWTHVAWTRSNGANRLYVNGVLQSIGSGANPVTYPSTSFTNASSFASPQNGAIGNLFVGQISNFRITNGYAVYSGNFTPPTDRLTTTQSTGTNNIFPITSSVQPYSVSFNGSSQYLSVAANTAFAFGTGDFTVEAWVNSSVAPGANLPIAQSDAVGSSTNNKWWFAFAGTGLFFGTHSSGGFSVVTTTAFSAGKWYHVAVTRASGVMKMFINGVSTAFVTSGTPSGYSLSQNGITIGAMSTPSYWNGYISNLRIVNGLAVYTGSFTPPSSRLTVTQSAGTNIAAITKLTLDYGVSFNGSQYLSANNAALALGTENFTVEAWVYTTVSSGTQCVYDTRQENGTSTGFYFGLYASNTLLFYTGGVITINAGTVPANTWTHIALVRVGNTFTVYVNGTSVGTATNSNNFTNTIVQIGSSSNVASSSANYYTGSISNLRVVKGTAVYTGNFTQPTNRLTVTQSAGTNIAAIKKTTPDYSVLFNGTSQYLTIPSSTALQLATATPFAIEAWIYSTNMSAADHGIIGKRQGGNEWQLNIHPSFGHLNFWNGATTYQSNTTLLINTWYHVAVTWDATTLRFFVNGVMGSTYTGFTVSASTNQVIIGGTGPGASGLFAGYISNLRIVKGSAVYTANFAVPTDTLPVVAGTSLLALKSATFIDNSVNAHVMTPVGSPVISTVNLFGGTTVLLTAQDPVIQDNSSLASSISNVGAATTSIVTVFGGTTVLLTAQDPVIQDNSALALTITNTGATTTSTQNPFGSTALLTAQDPVIRDNSVNATVFVPTGGPGVSPLTPFGVTTLLTLQSNAGDDNNNIENFARIQSTSTLVNRVGTITPGPFGPFNPSGWSNFFNTGDKLTFPSSSAFDLSGDTWTIEFWMYSLATATAGNACRLLMAGANGDAGGWSIGFSNDGSIGYGRPYSGNPVGINTPAGTIALNTWYHVAFVCSAGSARIYINGTQAAGPVTISLPTSVSQTLRIGYDDPGTVNFQYNGYISNLRIVKDRAIYTGNFTPPSSRLLTSQSAGTNIASVKTTPDYSVLFNGTSQYLTTPSTANYNLSTGDFTVECWVYVTSQGNNTIFTVGAGGSSTWNGWEINNDRRLTWQTNPVGNWNWSNTYSSAATVIPLNSWTHIAAVRYGSNFSMYVNGTSVYSTNSFSGAGTGGTVFIGTYYANYNNDGSYFRGRISNFRIVKGSAMYTANFTVPTDILPVVAGTSLLILQSATFVDNSVNASTITPVGSPVINTFNPFGAGATALLTCQSNRFVDNSTNALAPTVTGTPVIALFSPLPPTDSYNPRVHGSSLYFSGSSSYLNFTQESNLYQFAGDFTIEAWVYSLSATGQVNYSGIFDTRAANTPSTTGIVVNLTPTGYLNFYINSNNYTSARLLGANNWTHVALVRSGSTISMYQNGVSVASVSYATSLSSGNFWVGTLAAAGTGGFWQGYISDLRAINGVAVYTSAFTPPTLPLSTTAQTVVLLNGNSAGIIDSIGENNLTTVGGAKLNHAIVKYGTGSIAMTATGDYCVASPPSVASDINGGDFTIEFWVYFTSLAADRALVSKYGNSAETAGGLGYLLQWFQASSVLRLVLGIGGGSDALYTWSWAPSISTWYHVAVTRSGTSGRAFINGTQIGSTLTLSTANFPSPNPVQIGKTHTVAQYLLGYMDELRISRMARYTANFTAPTALLSTGTYIQIG